MSHHSRIHAGPWSGGVTDTRATIKATILHDGNTVRLSYSTDPELKSEIQTVETSCLWADGGKDYPYKIVQFDLEGLTPDTVYHYHFDFDGVEAVEILPGSFRTFPQEGTRAGFKFAFASCSNSSEGLFAPNGLLNTFRTALWGRSEVYTALHEAEPDLRFFCHLGDFHYGDISGTEIAPRFEQYDVLLRREEPRRLFRHAPIALTWDDHDFLGNNAAGADPELYARAEVARDAYTIYVPHYPLVNCDDGIYQAFTYGRVLFLLTDTRFKKMPHSENSVTGKTLLGAKQKAWLKEQILHGRDNFDLVVWINTIGWIGEANPRSHWWAGYAEERAEIAEFIHANAVRNLCMISGDAHKLAIDDGTHAGYAEEGQGGFPVFHAAPLEGMPSEKAGNYTHGEKGNKAGDGLSGTGQYGVFEVRYENGENAPPHVYWEGKRVEKNETVPETLIHHDFSANQTYRSF